MTRVSYSSEYSNLFVCFFVFFCMLHTLAWVYFFVLKRACSLHQHCRLTHFIRSVVFGETKLKLQSTDSIDMEKMVRSAALSFNDQNILFRPLILRLGGKHAHVVDSFIR